MAVSDATATWTLRMPAGSYVSYGFTFQANHETYVSPYTISATAWEYVVRTTATGTGTPLFSITPTANASGLLTVTASASLSQVVLALYPAATSSLAPGTYYHALWENPGTTSAFTWWTGPLLIDGNPAP